MWRSSNDRSIVSFPGSRVRGKTDRVYRLVFRAFQGVGGSGLLSLPFVILPEMVEPKKYALYAALTSCAFVLGFLFGPLFGGAIVENTTWRWVFLIKYVE